MVAILWLPPSCPHHPPEKNLYDPHGRADKLERKMCLLVAEGGIGGNELIHLLFENLITDVREQCRN